MSKPPYINIIEEKNEISDHLIDIIGTEFKFDHVKGLAEWIKNSADAYSRTGTPDADQNIIIRFLSKGKEVAFECVDFVGMDEKDIQDAFKQWGDPEAAKRGLNKRVYGGHGNGGKFYMRQMFQQSYFVTYKNGHLNVFGFSPNKKYGFATGLHNLKTGPKEAIGIAEILNLTFPEGIRDRILKGKTGFTVVKGVGPREINSASRPDRILYKLANHPQARRILERIPVWALYGGSSDLKRLVPEEIKPLPAFEELVTFTIPDSLTNELRGEKISVVMTNEKFPAGKLTLKTSEEAFARGSRTYDLNRIDIIGEQNVIASYQITELGVVTFPQAGFIYGECSCPILEDKEEGSVKNDRTKLVENNRSDALLFWIKQRIEEYSQKIAEKEREKEVTKQQKISLAYNDFLNRWKDKFMPKMMGELFRSGSGTMSGEDKENQPHKRVNLEAPLEPLEFSYPLANISVGEPSKITLKASSPDPIPLGAIVKLSVSSDVVALEAVEFPIASDYLKETESGESVAVLNLSVTGTEPALDVTLTAETGPYKATIVINVIEGSVANKTKGPKSPQVLLSGQDDPLRVAPDGKVILSERDPVIYQRIEDVEAGIYWINTQSPLAKVIRDNHGDYSPRWRDYLFQRYVDIFVKQVLYEIQKKDPENFRAELVDTEIDKVIKKVHSAAVTDLGEFFVEEEFKSEEVPVGV